MSQGLGEEGGEIRGQEGDCLDPTPELSLAVALGGGRADRFGRFLMAALGSIPWVGGAIAGFAGFKADQHQEHVSKIMASWLLEHEREFKQLEVALGDVVARLDDMHEHVKERLESEEYLALVRKAFRTWDKCDTAEKRRYIQNLIAHAGASNVCSDDVVRLFLDWLDSYSDLHFRVIGEIYKRPGITRHGIWTNIYGSPEREDSAEADLYKLLIRDLSTGSVIRQHRETDGYGNFVRRKPQKRGRALKSAFDDEEPYQLTELGKQFVHYAMDELVPRIGTRSTGAGEGRAAPEQS